MTKEKNEIEKLDLNSMNIAEAKRNAFLQLFPEIRTQVGKIDFEKLKLTFGELIDTGKERYGMMWPGKSECYKTIQTPSIGTLVPLRDKSLEFDQTENIIIEGDNLEVLKLLQKSYLSKIKLIYIDPPYNTGEDFIYPDNFSESLDTYLKYTSQKDSEGNKFSTNIETDGRYHSKWLNMMYPRLYLARNLLNEDGVIAIHIDEHEQANLEKLLNEIYGEENKVGIIVWDKRNPKGDAKGVAYQHESIYLYAKNLTVFNEKCEFVRPKLNANKMLEKAKLLVSKAGKVNDEVRKEYKEWISKQDFSGGEKAYQFLDEDGEIFRPVSMAWPNKKQAPDEYLIPLKHPITGKDCPVPGRGWRNPPATMKKLLNEGKILFGKDESTQPNRKYLLKENMDENVPSLIYFGGSDDVLLKELKVTFDNPKPVELVKRMIQPIVGQDEIVLDFFAGSGTTGHAVIEANKIDNKKRKYILIQLPEQCSTSQKNIETISDITVDRMKKVKLATQSETNLDKLNLDLGMKVFRLDESCFKTWPSQNGTKEDVEKQLELHVDHLKHDRTAEDILYEILLKSGFTLATPVENLKFAKQTVYSIAGGMLLVCLEVNLTLDLIKHIADQKPERVVCLDQGFANNDQLKANAVQIFRTKGIASFKTV